MNVLLSRKDTIRFLILSELMVNPECNQRDIARKLSLTPQAISEHFKEMVNEGLINVVHKGYYEVTRKGEEWMSRNLIDLHLFSEELLKNEMEYLLNFWKELQERAKRVPAPGLIYSELPLELRVVREYLSSQTREIIVDQPEVFKRVKDYLLKIAPHFAEQVHLWQESEPLFEKYGVELELDRALEKRVWLKSGGFIIIDETEALTTIDVNTGKYVGKKSFEDTVFKTNLEASREIVSQLRLRNIGGIIIIDFIDMDKPRNRQKILEALKEELKKDKAKSVVVKISEIGLTEMTRQRSEPSLIKKLCQPCPYCEGKGYIKSARTICYELYREMEKNYSELAEKSVKLYVNPMIAELLLGEEKRLLEMLKDKYKMEIEVLIRDNFHQEQYEYVVEQESEPGA